MTNNKLIAEFMGVKIGIDKYSWRVGCSEPLLEGHLDYDKSWGWLMPVVEKISRITVEWENSEDRSDTYYPRTFGMLNESTKNPMVRFNGCPVFEADTLLEATYLAVVDFITNFNQTT